MLGLRIADPDGVEGAPGEAAGLGLLDVETVMTGAKTLEPVGGRLAGSDALFSGYEMHVGRTAGPGTARPCLVRDDGRPDGAVSPDGRIAGAYVHGLFERASARAAILSELGAGALPGDHATRVDAALDEIAATLSNCLDIDAIARIAGL